MIAIGRGALMERVLGSPDLNVANAYGISGDSLWLGGRMGHKLIDRTGDSYPRKTRWRRRQITLGCQNIETANLHNPRHGRLRRPFRPRPRTLPTGPVQRKRQQHLETSGRKRHRRRITAHRRSRGTGTAAGGKIEFQTAPAGTKSKNRKNALKTAIQIDTNYKTKNATPMLLWDSQSQTLKRVLVGPPTAAGKAFGRW